MLEHELQHALISNILCGEGGHFDAQAVRMARGEPETVAMIVYVQKVAL